MELAEKQKADKDHIEQLKHQIYRLPKPEIDQKGHISESTLVEIQKTDRDHIDLLKKQIVQLSKVEKDQKTELSEATSKLDYLQVSSGHLERN